MQAESNFALLDCPVRVLYYCCYTVFILCAKDVDADIIS